MLIIGDWGNSCISIVYTQNYVLNRSMEKAFVQVIRKLMKGNLRWCTGNVAQSFHG